MEPPTTRKSRDPLLRHPGLVSSVYGLVFNNSWTGRCVRTGATNAAAEPSDNARTTFILAQKCRSCTMDVFGLRRFFGRLRCMGFLQLPLEPYKRTHRARPLCAGLAVQDTSLPSQTNFDAPARPIRIANRPPRTSAKPRQHR